MGSDGFLEVFLGKIRVGDLVLLDDERTEFSLGREYREMERRPVLGQAFEDDLERRHSSRVRLPQFFSNLLPEGPLRKLLARRAGIHSDREFHLLAWFGEDLPGNVTVRPVGDLDRSDAGQPPPSAPQLRFSLSGVQLKISMVREGRGLTLPFQGQDGDWIVKFPDSRLQLVPANEFSMMHWAQKANLDVAEHRLVRIADLTGIPGDILEGTEEAEALSVKRFDRSPAGRLHMEEFAQVFGLYPAQKYDRPNYETIARVLLEVVGEKAVEEFVRRLVFVVASGNGDAHTKNWALLYGDGMHASLSPAYDLVSTIQYLPLDDMALNLAESKRFEDVSIASFERMARKIGREPSWLGRVAREAAVNIWDAWTAVRSELPLPEDFKQRIEDRRGRLPLFSVAATPASSHA